MVSGLAGSALAYLLAAPNQPSLGASGAIFGLFGATAVLMRRLNYDMRPIIALLVINLIFTFGWSSISWQAHVGGLVAGTRRRRTRWSTRRASGGPWSSTAPARWSLLVDRPRSVDARLEDRSSST